MSYFCERIVLMSYPMKRLASLAVCLLLGVAAHALSATVHRDFRLDGHRTVRIYLPSGGVARGAHCPHEIAMAGVFIY